MLPKTVPEIVSTLPLAGATSGPQSTEMLSSVVIGGSVELLLSKVVSPSGVIVIVVVGSLRSVNLNVKP